MVRKKPMLGLIVMLAAIAVSDPRPAQGTVLLFNTGQGGLQAHGDHVTSVSQNGHTYLEGLGWTPDIAVEYGSEVSRPPFWIIYGGLAHPFIGSSTGNVEVTLTSDNPAWDVALESVVFATRNDAPTQTLEHVIVWDQGGTGESLFLESGGAAPAGFPGYRVLEFGLGVQGHSLKLEIATGPGLDWVGIDELSFFQVPAGYSLGDANQDHAVDLADFGILKANFGKAFPAHAWGSGDFNLDRKVDLTDFAALKATFGRRTATAVPEPQGWLLALLAFTATAGTRSIARRARIASR